MARIRTIKPSFFTDPDMAALSLSARLTYIGLWTHADDAGRALDDARLVKAAIWPLDDRHGVRKVEADLEELATAGRIQRYEAEGKRVLRVLRWNHQKINRPQPSSLPEPPPLRDHSVNGHGAHIDHSRQEGKGRESKNPPTPLDDSSQGRNGTTGGQAPRTPRSRTSTAQRPGAPSMTAAERRRLLGDD